LIEILKELGNLLLKGGESRGDIEIKELKTLNIEAIESVL